MNLFKISFISLVLVLSSCGMEKWTPKGISTVKINTNISPSEINSSNKITVKNLKGESRTYTSSSFNYDAFDEYNFTQNQFSKKRRTLIVSHPNYNPDTIIIRRKLRPGLFTLDLLGAMTLYLSPSMIIDFANGNIWRIHNKNKNLNLNLKHQDDFYRRKLTEIDSTIFSTTNVNEINRLELQKNILRSNLMWDGSDDLLCYYSGEKISVPPFNPEINRKNRSKIIYVIVDWYPYEKHSFFNQTVENKDIVGLNVTLDSLGRSCYVSSNDLVFGKNKVGPFTLLKFATKENAKAWLSGMSQNSQSKDRESELYLKLEEYKINFPESPYLEEVSKKIYEYKYIIAINDNSISALENYLISYPESPYSPLINEKLSKVNQIIQKPTLSLEEIEYLMSNYLGSNFIKKYEEQYLLSLFNEKSKNLKNLEDLNTLERELKTFEKLSRNFLDDKLTRNLFELKKKFFAEALKQNSNLSEVCMLEEMSNSYYNYEKFNDTDNGKGGRFNHSFIKKALLKDNQFLNGKYIIDNEIYNFKNGLLHGEYSKIGSDGSIIVKGEYKADPQNNRSIPVENHLFTYIYDDGRGFEKELIRFDQNGNPLSIEKFDQNGRDLIKNRNERYFADGDEQLAKNNFEGARNFYRKASLYECDELRWNYSYNYVLNSLFEKTLEVYGCGRNGKFTSIPILSNEKDINDKIKFLEKKQKEYAEEKRAKFLDLANKYFNEAKWYEAYTNFDEALRIRKDSEIESKRDIANNNYFEEVKKQEKFRQEQELLKKDENKENKENNKPEGAILKDYLVAMSGRISYNGYGDGANYLSGFTRNGSCYTKFNGVSGKGGYEITRINGNLTLKIVTSSNTYEFTAYKNLYEKWEFSLSNIENGDYNLKGTSWQNQ
jgi:hypothetical protein